MSTFLHHISLAAPLFVLVFVGYGLMHWGQWPQTVSQALSRFVFSVALPARFVGKRFVYRAFF